MYKLAIFDLDGTILDTLEDLAGADNYCLQKFGMPRRSLAEIRSYVGNGIYNLILRSVPEGTAKETVDEMFPVFNAYYKDHCAEKTRPYEGICEIIGELRQLGVVTAVVSNKRDYAVKSLCEEYFPGLFDYSVGDREGQRRKPAPDSVNAVLEQFGIDRGDAVYIGDSEVDIATAKNAQMDLIMVGWGFRDEAYLKQMGAQTVYHCPEELKETALFT